MMGEKTVECRSRFIKTPVKDLLVCSSKTASAFLPFPGIEAAIQELKENANSISTSKAVDRIT